MKKKTSAQELNVPAGHRILMLLENCSYPRDDRVRRETRALRAAGYDLTVICPSLHGQPRQEVLEGVRVIRFPAPPTSRGTLAYLYEYGYTMSVMFALSVYAYFHRGFDIVHAHQPPDTLAFIAGLYKLLGKKYVLDHHDLAPELYDARFNGRGNAFVRRLLLLFEKAALRLADHVIATNQSYRRVEMERGGVPSEHITVVRNGPDLDEVFCGEPDPALRPSGKTIIGYVGVMGVQDGVDQLLRAIRYLTVELGRKDVLCLMVGSGAAMPSLVSLAQELELDGAATFVGWVEGPEQVRRYLNSMDICVAPEPADPYNEKSTAAKVMEYMAVGKPIVTFDLPEHRFSAQNAAVYARPNDARHLAEQLVRLIDCPQERKKLGDAGLSRIRTELAWQHQSVHLVRAYQQLSAGHSTDQETTVLA